MKNKDAYYCFCAPDRLRELPKEQGYDRYCYT